MRPQRPEPRRIKRVDQADKSDVWNGLEPEFVRDAAAERLKALAHHDRLRIVEARAGTSRNVGEIAAAVRLPSSTISRHLRVLHDAEVVKCSRSGNNVRYVLADRDVLRLALLAYRGAGGQVRQRLRGRRVV